MRKFSDPIVAEFSNDGKRLRLVEAFEYYLKNDHSKKLIIVARGELIKMIKKAGDKVKDNINIIVAAEKVSKLFIDAGVSLFGKEQIQIIESKEDNNYRQMNMSELIALANANREN